MLVLPIHKYEHYTLKYVRNYENLYILKIRIQVNSSDLAIQRYLRTKETFFFMSFKGRNQYRMLYLETSCCV